MCVCIISECVLRWAIHHNIVHICFHKIHDVYLCGASGIHAYTEVKKIDSTKQPRLGSKNVTLLFRRVKKQNSPSNCNSTACTACTANSYFRFTSKKKQLLQNGPLSREEWAGAAGPLRHRPPATPLLTHSFHSLNTQGIDFNVITYKIMYKIVIKFRRPPL